MTTTGHKRPIEMSAMGRNMARQRQVRMTTAMV
jgi:hypothetical protein